MKKIIFSLLVAVVVAPLAIQAASHPTLFPKPGNITLTVVSPNGGETWMVGEKQTITWKAYIGPSYDYDVPLLRGAAEYVKSTIAPLFLYAPLDIDLIKTSDPSYVYRIASVNLYDSSYTWVVPENITADGDYRIRITVSSFSDSSDGAFSIKNDRCPVSPEIIRKAKEQIKQIEALIAQLQTQVNYLKSILE